MISLSYPPYFVSHVVTNLSSENIGAFPHSEVLSRLEDDWLLGRIWSWYRFSGADRRFLPEIHAEKKTPLDIIVCGTPHRTARWLGSTGHG